MANASLLFIDPKQTKDAELASFGRLHTKKLPAVPLRIINFFSSGFEDLQIISKHRIVLLPTYVIVTHQNKSIFRVSGKLPTAEILNLLSREDNT